MTEYYYWYKNAGVCPKCRVNRVAEGHSACTSCLEKDTEKKRAERACMTSEQKRLEYSKCNQLRVKRHAYRKAHGLCIYCGKQPATPNYVSCEACRAKKRGEKT